MGSHRVVRWKLVLGVTAVFLLLIAALALLLQPTRPPGFAPAFVLLSGVGVCFGLAYYAVYVLALPPLRARLVSLWAVVAVELGSALIAGGLGAELAARAIALVGGSTAEHRARFLPVGLALLLAIRVVELGFEMMAARLRAGHAREALALRDAAGAELELARLIEEGEATASVDALLRISVRRRGVTHLFDPREISHFSAESRYVVFTVGEERFLLDDSLDSLERRLDRQGFLRVHRSELLNLARVRVVRAERNGLVAETDDGHHVPVSRRRAPALRRLLDL